MAYTQILRVLHRGLHQAATCYAATTCGLTRVGPLLPAVSAGPGPLMRARAAPALSHRPRGFSLDSASRSRTSPGDGDKSVSRFQSGSPQPSATQRVKEAGRDFTYFIVVLIGLGVTGGLLYVVFQELFSSSSPNNIYGKAFNKVKSHPEVIGAFGEPVKCYGETTRRGRRQQVSHMEYLKEGLKYMRLKFYIEGSEPGVKGTVHSESKENNETGKYEFHYIFVDVDTYPRRTIVVEDNRKGG